MCGSECAIDWTALIGNIYLGCPAVDLLTTVGLLFRVMNEVNPLRHFNIIDRSACGSIQDLEGVDNQDNFCKSHKGVLVGEKPCKIHISQSQPHFPTAKVAHECYVATLA